MYLGGILLDRTRMPRIRLIFTDYFIRDYPLNPRHLRSIHIACKDYTTYNQDKSLPVQQPASSTQVKVSL